MIVDVAQREGKVSWGWGGGKRKKHENEANDDGSTKTA